MSGWGNWGLGQEVYDPDVVSRTDQLRKQFADWWKSRNEGDVCIDCNDKDFIDSDTGEHTDHEVPAPPAPINEWSQIEDFMSDEYPAAYRGLTMGMEKAQPLIDQQKGMYGDPIPAAEAYESGPEAVAQYGYDPKEIAAGMLLLHNQSHGYRTDLVQADHDRLAEIARIRSRQQRVYEQQRQARRQFLAMAWQDWAPKIQEDFFGEGYKCGDNCAHGQPHPSWPHGISGRPGYFGYWINHGVPVGKGYGIEQRHKSALTYTHGIDNEGKPHIAIGLLETHPDYRNDGVAEALIRKLHEDHPGIAIKPGNMSTQGHGFFRRMLEKEPQAKDFLAQRLAMAWQDWAPHIQEDFFSEGNTCGDKKCPHGDPSYGDRPGVFGYWINHGEPTEHALKTPNRSSLTYSHQTDYEGKPYLQVGLLETHFNHRNDGVAESLVRRLAEDHPGMAIRPGWMTDQGQAFHDRMLEKEPDARDLIVARRQFLAMAWQDWSPQIQGGCSEGECGMGRGQKYFIKHPDPNPHHPNENESYVNFYHNPDNIYIGTLYTHPNYRKDGVAESLMRRLVEDHPGMKINPGIMLEPGHRFHDRMLEKEPRARDLIARRRFLAMAWDEWKDKIQHYGGVGGGNCAEGKCFGMGHYEIEHPDSPSKMPSSLRFWHKMNGEEPYIAINEIYTNPHFRNNGIMEALMRRLVEDHPGQKISAGYMTPDGQAFHDRMLEKEPAARDFVTAYRLAMAWPDWYHKIKHDPPDENFNQGTFSVDHGDNKTSYLDYYLEDGRWGPQLSVGMLEVHPEHRRDGIAHALMHRLHDHYPELEIDPGPMTDDGQAFHDSILKKEPDAKDKLTSEAYENALVPYDDWGASYGL